MPPGPNACVISVWQLAHNSDFLMCSLCVGFQPPSDVRMAVVWPSSTLYGPYTSFSPKGFDVSILNCPTNCSREPKPSGEI